MRVFFLNVSVIMSKRSIAFLFCAQFKRQKSLNEKLNLCKQTNKPSKQIEKKNQFKFQSLFTIKIHAKLWKQYSIFKKKCRLNKWRSVRERAIDSVKVFHIASISRMQYWKWIKCIRSEYSIHAIKFTDGLIKTA